VSGPGEPFWSATIPNSNPNEAAHGLALSNGLLYVGTSLTGLHIYRINPLGPPTKLSGNNEPSPYGDIQTIAVFDHYLVASGYMSMNSNLFVMDVRDPANPVKISGLRMPDGATGITMMGRYAILTSLAFAVYVADLSDPANPVWVDGARLIGHGGYQIERLGAYLYFPLDNKLYVEQLQLQGLP
jgi:hypothetical protein